MCLFKKLTILIIIMQTSLIIIAKFKHKQIIKFKKLKIKIFNFHLFLQIINNNSNNNQLIIKKFRSYNKIIILQIIHLKFYFSPHNHHKITKPQVLLFHLNSNNSQIMCKLYLLIFIKMHK